ncbi:MAG: hypothetical protein HUU57_10570 [Bdellovibrio sp.]|nr:hypothetical protein [Bdellovibrio sp.]
MMRNLSVGLLTILTSSHAFSFAQINSEFELVIPRQFQEHLIDDGWETFVGREFQGNWQFSDQQMVSQGVPVQLKGVNLNMRTHLQKPTLGSGGNLLTVVSKGMQAQVHISEVSVDHVVEKEVGGIVGRFRIQALCKDVVLNLTPGLGEFAVAVTPVVGGTTAKVEVQDVNLKWSTGAWKVGALSCTGVQGFEGLISEAVEAISNDSVSFVSSQKENLKKYVSDAIQGTSFDFSKTRRLLVSRPDIQVAMSIAEYRDLGEQGIRARGNLEISFLKAPDKEVQNLKLLKGEDGASEKQAFLRLPKDFIKEIATQAYAANSWSHQVDSSAIPGFATLMRSRFYQFFVWPALMDFPKHSKFIFDIFSNQNIEIQGEGLNYRMKAPLFARMKAPKGAQMVPFMNFSSYIDTKIALKVIDGKLLTTMTQPALSLNSQWDAGFLSKYSPSKRFSSSLIRDYARDAVAGKTMTFDIPEIPLADTLKLKVRGFAAPSGQDVTLYLSP